MGAASCGWRTPARRSTPRGSPRWRRCGRRRSGTTRARWAGSGSGSPRCSRCPTRPGSSRPAAVWRSPPPRPRRPSASCPGRRPSWPAATASCRCCGSCGRRVRTSRRRPPGTRRRSGCRCARTSTPTSCWPWRRPPRRTCCSRCRTSSRSTSPAGSSEPQRSPGCPDSTMAPKCEVVTIGERGRPARRWLLVRGSAEGAGGTAVEQRGRHVRSCRWALPLDADGRPAPLGDDVLHAPTVTTERLALPARLIADVPLDPDRRRVRTGAATDTVLRAAADAYLDLVAAVAPDDRLALVPAAGFPRSELDARLRALLLDALRAAAWLPGADGDEVAPRAATVLDLPGPRTARAARRRRARPARRDPRGRAAHRAGRRTARGRRAGRPAARRARGPPPGGGRSTPRWSPPPTPFPACSTSCAPCPSRSPTGAPCPDPPACCSPGPTRAGSATSRCPGCTSSTRTPCTRCWSGWAPRSPSPTACSTTRRCATRSSVPWTTPRRGWTRCRWPRPCSGWWPSWGRWPRRRATGSPRSPSPTSTGSPRVRTS